jgi:hypothetical protein
VGDFCVNFSFFVCGIFRGVLHEKILLSFLWEKKDVNQGSQTSWFDQDRPVFENSALVTNF